METFLRSLRTGRGRVALIGLILMPCLVELLLIGADHRLWGSPLWRGLVYQYGGFWAGLLRDWQPNYPLQPWVMFLTYALLHAGPGHLVGNMLCLAWLGDLVAERLGGWGLLRLYALSALGGALAFGLLSHSPAPMVGASGAIFGLAGYLTLQDAPGRGAKSWGRAGLILLALILVNLGMWALQAGNLAWETHLGGTVTGMGFALYPRLLAKTRS